MRVSKATQRQVTRAATAAERSPHKRARVEVLLPERSTATSAEAAERQDPMHVQAPNALTLLS